MEGDNNKWEHFRRLIYIILLVYAKVKTVKPIDAPSGASFCRNRGSKLAKTAMMKKTEHIVHFGYFWRGITINADI